ncbi:MAG: hypothetical protein K0U38_02125, partial [Epsilonproteobacteria bacterium]|nr:hypothetical protein [Campylobacterota bacterium]
DTIRHELPNYNGLTKLEKQYGLSYLDDKVPEKECCELLIKKFAEKSLDIRPFLQQIGLIKSS